jgi:DNA replication protein DnaC
MNPEYNDLNQCPKCKIGYIFPETGGYSYACKCFDNIADEYAYRENIRKLNKRLDYSDIPEKYHRNVKFIDNGSNGKIKHFVNNYVSNLKENVENGKSVIFIGNPGIGKTMATCYIGMKILVDLGKWVKYISLTKFIIECNALQYKHSALREYVSKYVNASILIIDDIGESRTEDWHKKHLFELFDGRNNHKCVTLMSTMRIKEDLQDPKNGINSHIVSRIEEMVGENIVLCDSQIDMREHKNKIKYGVNE